MEINNITFEDFIGTSSNEEKHIFYAEDIVSLFNNYTHEQKENIRNFIDIISQGGHFESLPIISNSGKPNETLRFTIGFGKNLRNMVIDIPLFGEGKGHEEWYRLISMIIYEDFKISFTSSDLLRLPR